MSLFWGPGGFRVDSSFSGALEYVKVPFISVSYCPIILKTRKEKGEIEPNQCQEFLEKYAEYPHLESPI